MASAPLDSSAAQERKSRSGPIATGCAVLVVLFILVAVALPRWSPRFEGRARQSEAKSALKALFTAEKAYFEEHDHYETTLEAIGYRAEAHNRYACFLSRIGPLEDRSSAEPRRTPDDTGWAVDSAKWGDAARTTRGELPALFLGRPLGVNTGPGGHFTLACAGNIDGDGTRDVWSISDEPRTDPDGRTVQPGEPYNDVNDLLK